MLQSILLPKFYIKLFNKTQQTNNYLPIMKPQPKKVAPDGGWGWVACFGVSLVNVSINDHLHFIYLFIAKFLYF